MLKKLISLLIICLYLVGCTNLAFNERFRSANWNKVIIAPFSGNSSFIAEEEFEHTLAISPKLIVVSSSMIKIALKENELEDLYKIDPNKAIFDLAIKLDADGIIFAKIDSSPTQQSFGGTMYANSASIYAKLIDVNSKAIVASSQHDSSSILSNSNVLAKEVSQKAIEEFELFFDKIIQK